MKKVFRALVLGIFMVALTVGATTSTFAQDDGKATLYAKYTDNYAGNMEQRREAIKAAKQYIEKYGSSADDKEIVDYLKSAIPALEQGIKDELEQIEAAKKRAEKQARYNKFDSSFKAKDWDGVYQSGAEILAYEPDMLDVTLVLGSIGFDEIVKNPPIDKYNEITIKYAKKAIEMIEGGAKSKKFGAFIYEYDNANNAKGWMNYIIGMIMYHRQGKTDAAKKTEAVGYLFKATQIPSDKQKEPRTYGVIGDWYFDKALSLGQERAKLDKTEEANFKAIDDSVALERAYADRALDAYARAYNLAKADVKEPQAYKDGLLKTINDLYNFRYLKPEEKTPAQVNMYIAGVMAKPMPNPLSAVTPIVEAKPDEKAVQVKTGASSNKTVSSKTQNP